MRIGDLRKWLAAEEAKWTEMDRQYMGDFENQEILVPHFEWNRPDKYDPTGSFEFKGMGHDLLVYWDVTGLGLFIDHK